MDRAAAALSWVLGAAARFLLATSSLGLPRGGLCCSWLACRRWLASLVGVAAPVLWLRLPALLVLADLLDHVPECGLASFALLPRHSLRWVQRVHAAQVRRPHNDLVALVDGAYHSGRELFLHF